MKLLLLEMSQAEALRVFSLNGEDVRGANAKELKAAYRRLVRKHQSELGTEGGRGGALQSINAAFDVLRASGAGSEPGQSREQPKEPKDTRWAWAGHSGGMAPSTNIYRTDYTDQNYFKMKMWELSGRSNKEYTIWAFDGHFFRSVITVYGSEDIFDDMARAMVVWNSHGGNPYKTRAVFVSEQSRPNELKLIYLDGHLIEPIEMEHESFNRNPGNDQSFVRRLPEELDGIARKLGIGK